MGVSGSIVLVVSHSGAGGSQGHASASVETTNVVAEVKTASKTEWEHSLNIDKTKGENRYKSCAFAAECTAFIMILR